MNPSSGDSTRGTARLRFRIGFALAGIVALLAFLPWAAWLGSARAEEMSAYWATIADWAIWLAILLPIAWLAQRLWGGRIDAFFEAARSRFLAVAPVAFALGIATISFIVSALLSGLIFQHSPHLVDTVAQMFQARIFAAGSLSAPAPEAIEFFTASHLVRHSGAWFSQYPPGHSALLAPAVIAGFPWLVNPVLTAGTVALLVALARRMFGPGIARLAGLLYLVSPFALFMGASYMNHVSTTFFLTLALYATVRLVIEGELRWTIVAGLGLGAAATIRPLEALAWALVLGTWLLLRRGLKPTILTAAVSAIGAAPLLAYNAATTGHAFRFGYTLLWGGGHGLGFHTDPWGEPFTPLTSFANTALDFQRLNVLLFDWPFPSLLFLLVALALLGRRRRVGVLAALFVAAPVAYFFYWHRDNYLGPRFLHASLVPAVLLTAVGIGWFDSAVGRWRPAFRIIVVAGLLMGVALNLPARAGSLAGLEPEMKLNPEPAAASRGVDEALVLVKVGWGSRLIGRLWGWGVPASEVESSYRRVDGCRLQLLLDEARARSSEGEETAAVRHWLRGQLADLRAARLPVTRGLLPDASVRVDTRRPLAEPCRVEVARDRAGFTVYGSLVWRNDPWLRGGLVYARSLGPEHDPRIRRDYADRPHFLYAPVSPEPHSPLELFPLTYPASEAGDTSIRHGGSR